MSRLHYTGFSRFVPGRLTEAREARGYTKRELSDKINLSHQAISKIEQGISEPNPDTLNRFSDCLNLPVYYFLKPFENGEENINSVVFFRSNAAARVKSKKVHKNRVKWLRSIHKYLETILDFPKLDIRKFSEKSTFEETDLEEIDKIALNLRKEWGLGLGPISNLTLLLEKKGIIVSRANFDDVTIDACSIWEPLQRPYILLGNDKMSAVRSRFDAAHELGHLILHSTLKQNEFNIKSNYKRIEKEANHFASAFLLPEESFGQEITYNSLDYFIPLKERWKVSIGAMLYRAEYLNILSDYQVLHTRKVMSKNKMRTIEPLDDTIPLEIPSALKQAIELILEHEVKNKQDLVHEIGLDKQDIEILSGLPLGTLSEEVIDNSKVIPFQFKNK